MPPNILFIMTDQQTAAAMSCAGDRWARTPGMDRIASRGTRFERAYCTFPLCTPSRFSLLTGRWPHEIDCHGNAIRVPDDAIPRSLGAILRAEGYDCGYGGKWHLGSPSPTPPWGFEVIHPFDDVGLDHAAIQFLQRKRDRPFFLVASFDNPHNICEWARQQPLPRGPIEEAPTERCPNLPANFALAPHAPMALTREKEANHAVHPTLGVPDDWWRHYRHAYRKLIEKVDAQILRILDALRDSGQEQNTLIVFTSDHGDGDGAHQWNQKSALYEEPARVPFILSPPGGMSPTVNSTHLVSNGLDLLPTLCDYASVAPPPGLEGASLRPLVERPDAAVKWRDALAVVTAFPTPMYLGTAGRMIVTARHKYAVYNWGRHREQLHDLSQDPGEMVNLAVEACHAELLQSHRERLRAWALSAGDKVGLSIVP